MAGIFEAPKGYEVTERQIICDDKVLKKWVASFVIREDVTLKEDGSVDVNGDVDFISRRENSGQSVILRVNPLFLDQIPLRFNEIKGNFDCSDCRIDKLDHLPEKVGGDFICRGYISTLNEEDIRGHC